MKKLISAIMLLTISATSNAAIISITESHKLVGDENPLRLMWKNFDQYREVLLSGNLPVAEETDFYPLSFYGTDQHGNKTDQKLASWNNVSPILVINELYANEYPHGPDYTFAKFFTPTENMFQDYIGMELSFDRDLFSYHFSNFDDDNFASSNLNNYAINYTYDDSTPVGENIESDVPEPASFALLCIALAGGLVSRKRHSK